MNGLGLYTLDANKQPVPCDDMLAWNEWLAGVHRHVAKTQCNQVRVSTIFLGLDHNFSRKGAPILFETYVFGGEMDGVARRYATWKQAEAGHRAVVKLVMARL